jgi:hypothetical protein
MLTRVRLAARDVPWTFQDTPRLSSWIEDTPWLRDGGVLAVRVSGPRQAEVLAATVRDAMRTCDAGASDVQVRVLGRSPPARTGAELLRETLELELSRQGDERRDVEAVARTLSIRPFSIIVDATGWTGAEARRAFTALDATSVAARKLVRGAALTAIVMHHEPLWAGGNELNLDVGEPVLSVVDALAGPEPALWASYVHHRLAWEAGGHLDRALDWNDVLVGSAVRTGDDAALEKLLGAVSCAAWAALPETRTSAVYAFLRASAQDPARARLRQDLDLCRLLWRPGGVTRIVPWAARAILIADPTPILRAQLRWTLTCAPLRRDLLSRCLDIEGSTRAGHARDLGDPPEEARVGWNAFRGGEPTSDARFYLGGSPAVPDGPFAFVDLGGFLVALRAGPTRLAALHRLRILRNYLAHGHYVAWACVREMLEIGLSIGG